MEGERKLGRAWTGWLAAAVIGVFIVYPLSIGPISCILYEAEAPDWVVSGFGYYCVPFAAMAHFLPAWAKACCAKYIS